MQKKPFNRFFIQLWTKRNQLEIKHKFLTYLSAAVRYQVVNILQQQFRHTNNIQPADKELTDRDWLRIYELAEQIEKSVEALPEKCRLVFRLSKQQGFSHKEIAARLSISEKTVEAHLSKAHRLLKISLKQVFSLFF